MKNEEIWNQPVPKSYEKHFIFEYPKNRKDWAQKIHQTIEVIEESTCSWDEGNIKILYDAFDYCEAYNLKKLKKKVIELRTKFFAKKSVVIDMNNLRYFFHDEWFNPTSDTRLTVEDRYEMSKHR